MWRPDSFFKNAKKVTFQDVTIPNHYIWLYKDKSILYMVKLVFISFISLSSFYVYCVLRDVLLSMPGEQKWFVLVEPIWSLRFLFFSCCCFYFY